MLDRDRVYTGDARHLAAQLAPQSVQCVVTSPPYFNLRSYLPADDPAKPLEMGGEATPDEFAAQLVALFAALRPALHDSGCVWLNLGDSFGAGKQLQGIPWRVAFALQADGWILRSDCIWAKPNPMPESVTDRPTRSHEYLFLLSKSARYFYDADAIREPHARIWDANTNGGSWAHPERQPNGSNAGHHSGAYPEPNPLGRNKRDVWTIPTSPTAIAHFATFPPDLIRPCIRAGCPVGGVVLDPFVGSGTTAMVAVEEGRHWLGFDLDPRAVGWTAERLRALPVRSLFAAD